MPKISIKDFQHLFDTTRHIYSSPDLKDTISAIVDTTVEILHADYAGVILLDDEYKITDEVENLSGIKPLSSRIRTEGITHRIISSGEPVFISDTSDPAEQECTNPELIKSKIRSYVGMPLWVEGSMRAILYLYSLKSHVFDDQQMILTTFANFAALAVKNADLVEEMRTLAVRDGLTGLYNYRYFHERLGDEINRSDRTGEPLSVIFMDMDNFKQINDTYGHLFGDRALKHFSDICKDSVRLCDIVARTGGDEIVALLPGADHEQAIYVMQRIKDSLKNSPLCIYQSNKDHKKRAILLTFSGGVSSYPLETNDDRELIRIADERLFIDKRAKTSSALQEVACSGC